MNQISTGDLLRNELKKESELSKQIRNIMDAGKLVSDKIIYDLIEDKISDINIKNKMIFDGFPRNIEQAKNLEIMLKKHDQNLSKVLNLKVDYSVLIKKEFQEGYHAQFAKTHTMNILTPTSKL